MATTPSFSRAATVWAAFLMVMVRVGMPNVSAMSRFLLID